jgi:transposase
MELIIGGKEMRPPRPLTHGQQNELQECLKRAKTKDDFRRVLCMWLRSNLSLNAEQVARAIGWSVSRVKAVQGHYFREGVEAFFGVGRGGRRNENLSRQQEDDLLAGFLERAKTGGVLVVGEVKEVYEKAVGHPVPKSTVYRMLDRHGWRKIAPRPRHPKTDTAAQEEWKKNSPIG